MWVCLKLKYDDKPTDFWVPQFPENPEVEQADSLFILKSAIDEGIYETENWDNLGIILDPIFT